MANELQLLTKTGLTTSLKPGTVVREQEQKEVVKTLCHLFRQIVKLYQIPNFDEISAVLLAEWVIEFYPNEQIETVIACLTKPHKVEDQRNWRLTPDTIQEWMAVEIERQAIKREKEVHNYKTNEVEGWSEEGFAAFKKMVEDAPGFPAPPRLTRKEIELDGLDSPRKLQAPVLPLTDIDIEVIELAKKYECLEVEIKEARRLWGLDCHDLVTGRQNEKFIPFAEWLEKKLAE